jgi:hypothetical protein
MKKRKPKYYAYQLGGSTNFNWNIPEEKTPSVVNQTATGATDIYGNQYFKQDNQGAPTFEGDVTGTPRKKFDLLSLLGNTNKTELHPAIQSLNAGIQTVTGIANMINEVKNRKYEKDQYLRAITPDYYENMEGYGLNANPVFTQYGGTSKYQVGGQQKPVLVNPYNQPNQFSGQSVVSGTNAFTENQFAMDFPDKRMSKSIDLINNVLSSGLLPNQTGEDKTLRTQLDPRMYNYLYQFNQRTDLKGMTPEQRINTFYNVNTNDPEIQSMKDNMKRYGYGPSEFRNVSPSNKIGPALVSMKDGGSVSETYGLQKGGKAFANVEAERGEVVENLDGSINQVAVDANTHEQGGVFLPNVHRVLENTSNIRKDKNSKILKLSSADVEEATGAKVKGSMSHAEALVKANDYYEGERNKITKKITLAAKDRSDLDKYGELSTKLNMQQFQAIPTQEQLFESLFNRQEAIKAKYDIPTGGQAKYGGGLSREDDYGSSKKPYASVDSSDFAGGGRSYPIPTKADAEDALRLAHLHGRSDVIAKVYAKYPELKKAQLGGYTGNKSGLKTPAGNSDAFPATKDFSFNDYLNDLTGKGFKYEGITNPKDFQLALYDYQLKNNPEAIKKMWGEGMHQAGMAQARKLGLVDDKGLFKQGALNDPKNLEKLRDIYADGILGVRTMQLGKKPPRIWSDDDIPVQDVPQLRQELDTSITTPDIIQQPRSRFNEPLRWYDVASPVNAYMAALEREPGKYNPAEFNQLRYKLLDPTVALQQNQADFNAAVDATQSLAPNNPGAAAANIANLAASKYAANNQVLGNYENQNAQIKNNEITYNTQVRDKNSLADQQARELFENKVLTSKAIQQEQKLTALDSLYKTIAENRALNRNGNLIMKFSRAFDQYGDYNGYAPIFTTPPAAGIQTQALAGQPGGGLQQIKAGKDYYNRRSGKTYYFDGNRLLQRK